MAESILRESYSITGLPGAQLAGRFAGTTSGTAPTTGTFLLGDFVIDQSGKTWVCTVAGSPGTWAQTGSIFTGGTIGNTTISGVLTVSGSMVTQSGSASFATFDQTVMTIMGAWE